MPPQARALNAVFGLFKSKKGRAGIATGGILGSGLFLFSIVQAPLQIVHFAQNLDRFHSLANNETFEGRLTNFWRYARFPENPEQRRVGVFARKSAAAAEAKFRLAGLNPQYEGGRMLRMDITNPDVIPELRKQGYEIKSDGGNRYIDIDPPGTNSRTARNNIKNLSGVMQGLDIRVGYIQFRNLTTKAGIKLLQMDPRRAAQNAEERSQKKNGFIKKVRDYVKSGTKSTGNINTRGQPDGEGNRPQNNSEYGNSKEEIRRNITRGSLGALGAAGVVCVVYSTAEGAEELNKLNKILPMMRLGATVLTLGSEVQDGSVDHDELSAFNDLLYDRDAPEGEQSWTNARSIQAELGKKPTGPDLPPSAHPTKGGNFVSNIVRGLPGAVATGLGGVCNAVGSTAGQVIGWGITLAGSAGSIAFNVVLEILLREYQDDVVNLLAGDEVSVDEAKGAKLGNYANYGTRLAANENAISAGGRQLSNTETAALDQYAEGQSQEEFNQQNFFARYVDPYDTRSLMGSMLSSFQPSITGFANGLLQLPSAIIGSIFSTGKLLFASDALAQEITPDQSPDERYSYGFDRFGFSLEELDNPAYQNPYQNAQIIGPKLEGHKEKIERCFGMTYEDSTGSLTPIENAVRVATDDRGDGCDDTDTEWTRVRFYILDTMVSAAAACWENDEEACSMIGAGGNIAPVDDADIAGSDIDLANIRKPSANIDCAAGTDDVGVYDGYTQGNKIRIRLCAIPQISSTGQESNGGYGVSGGGGKAIVNSRASGAWLELAKAASNKGVDISAISSFRTMSHQEELCNAQAACSAGDYSTIARPGTSNHQLGLAIDFSHGGKGGSSANCINAGGKCTLSGDATWEWLNNNAQKFGIKQLSNEFWHWSPLEN
jgi:hypothetical protein